MENDIYVDVKKLRLTKPNQLTSGLYIRIWFGLNHHIRVIQIRGLPKQKPKTPYTKETTSKVRTITMYKRRTFYDDFFVSDLLWRDTLLFKFSSRLYHRLTNMNTSQLRKLLR